MRCTDDCLRVGRDGQGHCSVPLWMNGVPAGFCSAVAYGPPEKRQNRYRGYVPGLACPAHGGPDAVVESHCPQGCRGIELGDGSWSGCVCPGTDGCDCPQHKRREEER